MAPVSKQNDIPTGPKSTFKNVPTMGLKAPEVSEVLEYPSDTSSEK